MRKIDLVAVLGMGLVIAALVTLLVVNAKYYTLIKW